MASINFTRAYKSAVALLLIFAIGSCSKDYFYSSEIEIPQGVWNSKNAVIFEPIFSDTTQNYNIVLSVSNTDDYRYNNIWFFIKTVSPDGFMHKDTLEYFLAEESGKWLGKREGESWTRKMYFKNQVRFPKPGKYSFEIQQGMREADLKGVSKVGILLEEINKN